MVLPSSYARSSPYPSTSLAGPSRDIQPSPRRRKYAAGLLSPPAIMPGGTSATPRIQGRYSPAQGAPPNPRRRSADRLGTGASTQPVVLPVGGRNGTATRQRSTDRLRELGQANPSMMSLGQLGQIMESDPIQPAAPPAAEGADGAGGRRRRRVVREDGARQRRLTVSTREEGLALGVARGASMRRTNVWDGTYRERELRNNALTVDLPESSDPPPAFPFPTSSSNRLPPAFVANSPPPPPREASSDTSTERPRSPPPSFEQAIGLLPIPAPLTPSVQPLVPPEIASSSMSAQQTRTNPSAEAPQGACNSHSSPQPSPTGTQWASAPSSPVPSELSLDSQVEAEDHEDREDRRMWNADLLAGYSLTQRVKREQERRMLRSAGLEFEREFALEQRDVRMPDDTDTAEATSAAVSVKPLPEPSEEEGGAHLPSAQTPNPEAEESSRLTEDTPPSTAVMAAENQSAVALHAESERPDIPASGTNNSDPEAIPNAPTTASSTPQHLDRGEEKVDDSSSETEVPPENVPEPPSSGLQPTTPPKAASHEAPVDLVPLSALKPTEAGPSNRPYGPLVESPSTPAQPALPAQTSPPIRVAETEEAISNSEISSETDRIISQSPPTRKLTRTKAVRRQSGGSESTLARADSTRSSKEAASQKPLFSTPGYTAAELEKLPEPSRSYQTHRLFIPEVRVAGPSASRPVRERYNSQPNIHIKEEETIGVLPPHREAALKRRESALGRIERKVVQKQVLPPTLEVETKDTGFEHIRVPEPQTPTGQLIDLDGLWPVAVHISPHTELRSLASTTAELLQLLEDGPVAESSRQGAAKAAAVQAVAGILDQQERQQEVAAVAPKKKAPPPPPGTRSRSPNEPLQRKVSILSTADSPITPRPVASTSEASTATNANSLRPPLPTRRPPPPPPSFILKTPALPPRPNLAPPNTNRQNSTASDTDSSVSAVTTLPVPSYQPRPRTALSARPRGPRPPPVPPRPWAKTASDMVDGSPPPVRPVHGRSISANPLAVNTLTTPSPPRSVSTQDLRSAVGRQPRSPEYTDLDVYVSRLEGSGREYEVSLDPPSTQRIVAQLVQS